MLYDPLVLTFVATGLPFAAYFLGIVIRKVALPGKNSPPLSHQLLLGIPFSLMVVSPMLIVFEESAASRPAFLLTLGIIIEHGMIVTETATKQLQSLIRTSGKQRGAARRPASPLGAALKT